MFKLGKRSRKELEGVDERLVFVVERALELSPVDFSVHDGMRTIEDQRALVAAGASWTMDSKHLIGKAVDLVPYINGKLRWEWPPIYKIADAMHIASQEEDLNIKWGGAWDVSLTRSSGPAEYVSRLYVNRCEAVNKVPKLDGAHFEIISNA